MKASLFLAALTLLYPPGKRGTVYIVTAGRNAQAEDKKFIRKHLHKRNVQELFPINPKMREVMDTMKTVRASIAIAKSITSPTSANGIYFYKLYSFWPNPKWRDSEFLRCFCLLDKRLITFTYDTVANRRVYNAIRPQLIQSLGKERALTAQHYLIQGGAYFK